MGCMNSADESAILSSDSQDIALQRPQDLVFYGDLLVIANSGFDPTEWLPGSITVVHAQRGEGINQLETSQYNPTHISTHDDMVYVVNTGRLDLSDFDDPKSVDQGAIDIFDGAGLVSGQRPLQTWLFPPMPDNDRNSAPSALAWNGNTGLVTSALYNRVWFFEATEGSEPPDMRMISLEDELNLALGAAAPWDDYFVVVDFNSDRGYLISNAGERHDCVLDLGDSSQMEGASSPLVWRDELYFILALSGQVKRLDLRVWRDECRKISQTVISPLGQVPNDLALWKNEIAVIHSGDNNVTLYDAANGSENSRLVLSLRSNPFNFAISEDGSALAVTEWLKNQITVFELDKSIRFQFP